MVYLFAAFDRDYYAKIIQNQPAQIEQYPPMVLQHLEKGGFNVNLTGQPSRAVAEAHKMCINKDMETAVVRCTKLYLQKLAYYSIIALKFTKT